MSRVLGIDPGSIQTGFACIEKENHSYRILTLGSWKPECGEHFCVVESLWRNVCEWIESFQPDTIVLEDTFAHPHRPNAVKRLAEVSGIILSALVYKKRTWVLIPPARVKKSLTGNGRVSKHQLHRYLIRMFPELENTHVDPDAFDALALAVCGSFLSSPSPYSHHHNQKEL